MAQAAERARKQAEERVEEPGRGPEWSGISLLRLVRELLASRRRLPDGRRGEIDDAILQVLAADGRTSMMELAERTGLSRAAVISRVRRLEEAGVIRGYGAQIEPRALGLPLGAYLRVRPLPGQRERVAKLLTDLEAVALCDRVADDEGFVARLWLRRAEELEVVIDRLAPYATTESAITLSRLVERRPRPSSASKG